MAMYAAIVIPLIGFVIAAAQNEATECHFKCINEQEFVINGGERMRCDEKEICNSKCKQLASGEDPPICATVEKLCPYECEAKLVKMGDLQLTCPVNMQCNTLKNSCDNMCVKAKCSNTEMYDCKDEKHFNLMGFTGECESGKVCNQDKKYPCDICISSGSLNSTTTTTSSEAPLATEPPSSTVPNCNMPSGSFIPCRYGPRGYYYKCVKVNRHSFIPVLTSCASWAADNICNRFRLC